MVELHKQNYKDNKKIYRSIESKIREKLGNNVPINHVGSTAIKNMWGKNIIDVLVGANSEYEMEEFYEAIVDDGEIHADAVEYASETDKRNIDRIMV